MVTAAVQTPVLDALSTHYARVWTGRGDARWLRHAWQTLAVLGDVPPDVPAWGDGAVDARLRLAVLARLSDRFNLVLEGEEPEVVDITEGPFAVDGADVLAWMREHNVRPLHELLAEVSDPDLEPEPEPAALDLTDVEFCIDQLSDDVLRTLFTVRPFDALFVELAGQRYERVRDIHGCGDWTEAEDLVGYPLAPRIVRALRSFESESIRAGREWLREETARIAPG